LSDYVRGMARKRPRFDLECDRKNLVFATILLRCMDESGAGLRLWHGICMPGVFSPQRRPPQAGKLRTQRTAEPWGWRTTYRRGSMREPSFASAPPGLPGSPVGLRRTGRRATEGGRQTANRRAGDRQGLK
jgi:hypothetical protein